MKPVLALMMGGLICCSLVWGEARIVSLSPATTEILCMLGLEKEIVGVTTRCDYPKSMLKKPKIGGFLSPNLEAVAAAKPSLVVGIGYEGSPQKDRISQLCKNSLWINSPDSIQSIKTAVLKIGQATGKETQAQAWIKTLQNLPNRQGKKTKSTMVIIWASPLMVAGDKTFIHDLIRYAGGVASLKNTTNYPKINPEILINANPDVILVTDASIIDALQKIPGITTLKAYKTKHILLINADLCVRPGPRLLEAIAELKDKLK